MKHNILVKFIDGVDYQKLLPEIKGLFDGLLEIKGINEVVLHTNCIDRDNRYDLLIQIDMAKNILAVYDESTVHKIWKQDYQNLIAKKAIFDYE